VTKKSLESVVRDLLREKFEEKCIVVWYDAGGTLEPILPRVVPEGVELLRFRGSYLAIRAKIERSDDLRKLRLIYVPREPLRQSWLRDYELFGDRLQLDLPNVLWSMFGVRRSPEL